MSFITEEQEGVTIIKVDNDRLDSIIAPQLKSELLLLVSEGIKKIIIELSRVTYTDSSGLGALLFGFRQLKNNHGQLKLCAANHRIMALVRIARLDGFLLNYQNLKEAISSFNES